MKLNIAARAGRWSAAHWKTAVSAWLVVLRRRDRARRGRRHEAAEGGRHRRGRHEDGRADAQRRRLPDRAGESVLVQSKTQSIGDPAFRAVVADVGRSVSRPAAGAARALAARRRQRRPGLARTGTRRSSSSRSGATRTRPTRRCSRSSTPSPRAQQRHARLHGRRVRLRQLDARAEQDAQQGLPAGRVLDAARDADHPARRVRSARRSRAAGAPRLLRRARDDRPLGAREPCRRRGHRDAVGDPADRDGRRGRLLALLPPARARGTSTRPVAPRRTAEGRRARPAMQSSSPA